MIIYTLGIKKTYVYASTYLSSFLHVTQSSWAQALAGIYVFK